MIFRKAQNKVEDPAKLRRLVADLIDREQRTSLGVKERSAPDACRLLPSWLTTIARMPRIDTDATPPHDMAGA